MNHGCHSTRIPSLAVTKFAPQFVLFRELFTELEDEGVVVVVGILLMMPLVDSLFHGRLAARRSSVGLSCRLRRLH